MCRISVTFINGYAENSFTRVRDLLQLKYKLNKTLIYSE